MEKLDILISVLKDKNRKKLVVILKEIIHFTILEKEAPVGYFSGLLYKNNKNYKDYIGYKKGIKITTDFFLRNGRDEVLNNKILFSDLLVSQNIATTNTIAYTIGKKMHINNKIFNIDDKDSFNKIMGFLLDKYGAIFIKPSDSNEGRNTYKISKFNEDFYSEISDKMEIYNFLFQKVIQQHKDINNIYDKSINTLRIHTFKQSDEIIIASGLMRFGMGNSIVDNGGKGGFYIPIDLDKWCLKGEGLSYIRNFGQTFTEHPDSKIKLDGYTLPYKKEVYELIEKSAKLFEKEFIGWDVALTNDGPIIVEGNDVPHIFMMQNAVEGFRNNNHYMKIFADYIN